MQLLRNWTKKRPGVKNWVGVWLCLPLLLYSHKTTTTTTTTTLPFSIIFSLSYILSLSLSLSLALQSKELRLIKHVWISLRGSRLDCKWRVTKWTRNSRNWQPRWRKNASKQLLSKEDTRLWLRKSSSCPRIRLTRFFLPWKPQSRSKRQTETLFRCAIASL